MTGRLASALLILIAALALFAPVLAPNDPGRQFDDRAYAPPMRVHVFGPHGLQRPFVYRQVLEDRLHRRYREDTTMVLPLQWFSGGHLASLGDAAEPLLLFGADPLGRDTFSRLLHGARLSLGVTLAGVIGAVLLGAVVGALAGSLGGAADSFLMLAADFMLVLPGAYLVLVLRSVLPVTLSTAEVFGLMAALFAVAAWPHTARGVRAIVATERRREYAEAARAIGAGPIRLARHLVPAAFGFLTVEIALLVPALLVAEATLSFLNLGFPEPRPSWGTMLQEAADVTVLREAPWMLAPAAALFVVVLAVQLLGARTRGTTGTGGTTGTLRTAQAAGPFGFSRAGR